MRNGDIATGDLARANLTRGYTAALSGEETIEGAACWRLKLTADDKTAYYARVFYWVAKNGFLPSKLEYYGSTGTLLKTVRYLSYSKGALGLRSMQLSIESLDEWKESSALTFANIRKLDLRRVPMTPEGMIALRDAAMAARDIEGTSDVSLERILRAPASPRDTEPGR